MKLTTYPFPMPFLMNLMLLPGTEGSPGHHNLFQRPLIIKKSPFVLGGGGQTCQDPALHRARGQQE